MDRPDPDRDDADLDFDPQVTARLSGVLHELINDWRLDIDEWQQTFPIFESIAEALDSEQGRDLGGATTALASIGEWRPTRHEYIPPPPRVRIQASYLLRALDSGGSIHRPVAAWHDMVTLVDSGLRLDLTGPTDQPPVRYVNSVLADERTDAPVPREQSLTAATGYHLLVNIGAPHAESLLPATTDTAFPQDRLPGGELWLRATLQLDGVAAPATVAFTLPQEGESFACDCPPDSAHLPTCEPRPWVTFPLTAPVTEGRWGGVLVIYYQTVAVHAQQLALPVGGRGGPGATLLYRLTSSFANLRGLSGRAASVLLMPNTSRVLVNGLSFVDSPFALESNAADAASRDARNVLYEIHLTVGADGVERSRYDADFGKAQDQFEADLRRLAYVGVTLYGALFGDLAAAQSMRALIRQEALARNAPALLAIAEPREVREGGAPIPWSLVYDLPVGSDPDEYQPCPSVRLFGPAGGGGTPVPASCPTDHTGQGNVLCPFGFWGLSSILEQPASAVLDAIEVVSARSDPALVLMATGAQLNAEVTDAHTRTLRDRLGTALAPVTDHSKAGLATALGADGTDVAYLYSHCGYSSASALSKTTTPYLLYGGGRVGPRDIDMWAQVDGWPDPHWSAHKPLVVVNGCHTAEATSGSLASFVSSFVNQAGAAGMIGTEVALDQSLAALFMEKFLARFVGGTAVGGALRECRWELLKLGNVMGLAYTPYCLSGLRMRPADGPPANEESTP